jgi:hypothetical protein
MCFTKEIRYPLTAEALPKGPATTAAGCASPPASFPALSWRVEGYRRTYTGQPGMNSIRVWASRLRRHMVGARAAAADEGLTFTLRNVASGELFKCSPGGSCEAAAGAAKNSVASYRFDQASGIIYIMQNWAACGDANGEAAVKPSSASGAAWLQEL